MATSQMCIKLLSRGLDKVYVVHSDADLLEGKLPRPATQWAKLSSMFCPVPKTAFPAPSFFVIFSSSGQT